MAISENRGEKHRISRWQPVITHYVGSYCSCLPEFAHDDVISAVFSPLSMGFTWLVYRFSEVLNAVEQKVRTLIPVCYYINDFEFAATFEPHSELSLRTVTPYRRVWEEACTENAV